MLTFGSEGSDYVRAVLGDRPYLDSEHAFDRNQVNVQIDLAVRPFRASFETTWMIESFSSFRSDLERAYESLEGTARFLPDYSRSLEVTLTGDGIGHFSIKGEACPNATAGPWLKFELPTIDQTYLPDMINALAGLETEYPVL